MAQFVCEICTEGFDQRSRLARHMAASHPTRAVSAADIEKVLAGIEFPATKRQLIEHASRRVPAAGEMQALKELPDRTYRDAAEVGIAYGEVKAPGRTLTAEEAAGLEPPSRRGGRAAATEAVSAAAIAKMLHGIEFPKSKGEIVEYARQHQARAKVADPEGVLGVIEQLPERRYASMAEVEIGVGDVFRRGPPA
jgi:hypothetical protein